MIPKSKISLNKLSRIGVSENFLLDKLSRIAILKTFARQTFAKKAKIREIRESFSD